MQLAYTALHGDRAFTRRAVQVRFNYPTHNATFSWLVNWVAFSVRAPGGSDPACGMTLIRLGRVRFPHQWEDPSLPSILEPEATTGYQEIPGGGDCRPNRLLEC